jgi:hypothetical protein
MHGSAMDDAMEDVHHTAVNPVGDILFPGAGEYPSHMRRARTDT